MALIKRVDLGDAATAALRDLILDGELPPGQRLIETELAERFGTSRGPVRDALAELEQSGLVTSQARRGSFVVELSTHDVAELYSLRRALEGLAAARAATSAGADDVADLRRRAAEIGAAAAEADRRRAGEADMEFHRAIVVLAGHRRLADSWNRLADQMVLLMRQLTHVRPDIQARGGDHDDIVDAIEAGDTERATAAVVQHLDSAERALMGFLATEQE